jgi:hypothetical protein
MTCSTHNTHHVLWDVMYGCAVADLVRTRLSVYTTKQSPSRQRRLNDGARRDQKSSGLIYIDYY